MKLSVYKSSVYEIYYKVITVKFDKWFFLRVCYYNLIIVIQTIYKTRFT